MDANQKHQTSISHDSQYNNYLESKLTEKKGMLVRKTSFERKFTMKRAY